MPSSNQTLMRRLPKSCISRKPTRRAQSEVDETASQLMFLLEVDEAASQTLFLSEGDETKSKPHYMTQIIELLFVMI